MGDGLVDPSEETSHGGLTPAARIERERSHSETKTMIPVSFEADQLRGQQKRRRRDDPGLDPGASRSAPTVGRGNPQIVFLLVVRGVLGLLFLLLLLPLLPGEARADDATLAPKTLAGTWNASSLVETWSTEAWGDACGPKPVGQGAPSGSVQVGQQGSELTFSGAGRPFSTTQCWDATPGIVRKSHSGGARGWITRCGSAPGDPRVATVTTNISATDDTIVLVEQGQYQFAIQDTQCKASASRRRSWKLVQRAGEAPPAPAATEAPPASASAPPPPPPATPEPSAKPTPAPSKSACEPGPPARLEVRPARKLVRPGDAFDLSWSAADAASCPVRVRPTLTVEPPASAPGTSAATNAAASIVIDERGRVTIDPKAAVGSADILVTLEGKTARVSIEVTTPERFDALLAERGLGEMGEAETAVVVLESAVGGSSTRATDGAHDRRVAFVAIVGGAAAALALAALIVLRQSRKPRVPERASTPAPPPLVALFDRPAEDDPMRCPQCREVFAPGTAFCATDGTALVPAPRARVSMSRATVPPAADASGGEAGRDGAKVCPTCGDRFDELATFCGRDGTQLVIVN
jgi:hypothetical protein